MTSNYGYATLLNDLIKTVDSENDDHCFLVLPSTANRLHLPTFALASSAKAIQLRVSYSFLD